MDDGADCIMNAVICAMREVFSPTSSQPPLGGGSDTVRLFAGDATPLGAVDMHIDDPDCGCSQPFLWARLVRRYRSRTFPAPYVGIDPCGSPRVVAIEVGVARCAVIAREACAWKDLEEEAEISMDDSWRIEMALCRASALMNAKQCSDMTATDAVIPYGPEGGLIAWTGTIYARVDT